MIEVQQGQLTLADYKRVVERLQAGGEDARQRLRENCQETAREWGIHKDISELRKLWDPAYADEPDPALFSEIQRDFARKLEFRRQIRQEGRALHPRVAAWRDRQVARCSLSLGPALADAIVHPPWCAELTRGCSVGCWFCGLSAAGLTGVYRYTPENQLFWSGLLDLMSDWLGPAARWGFCYWASDPLDNPDYEKFCRDFSDRLGMFPQTTTAQAWRNPQRVKALLALSEERGCLVNRFSVLTRSLLDKLHQQFSPDEMARVECVLQMNEAPVRKAQAGHARDPGKARGEKARQVSEAPTTIACVTGLLLRMVEQTVELVTPCPADERWPNGYYVLESASFRDLEHLRELTESWTSRLAERVEDLPRVKLGRGYRVEAEAQGLLLSSPFQQVRLSHPEYGPRVSRLAPLLEAGGHGAEELAMLMLYEHGLPEAITLEWLTNLFQRGWLDEEPCS